jgi:hypothetical protein
MPRKRVLWQLIENPTQRKTAGAARRWGWMWKGAELYHNCGLEVLSFAISTDGVVYSYSSMGNPLAHMDRMKQIYSIRDTPQTEFHIEDYNDDNVVAKFGKNEKGKRSVTYMDPRKKMMQAKKNEVERSIEMTVEENRTQTIRKRYRRRADTRQTSEQRQPTDNENESGK